ncbi:MAG: hypothetical protein JXB49_27730, partial [Bacteroidales bacterium]|nr:hypothetical protein [Bacteroidales bacterium]
MPTKTESVTTTILTHFFLKFNLFIGHSFALWIIRLNIQASITTTVTMHKNSEIVKLTSCHPPNLTFLPVFYTIARPGKSRDGIAAS